MTARGCGRRRGREAGALGSWSLPCAQTQPLPLPTTWLGPPGLTLASLQFWSSMMIWSSSSFFSLASVVTFSSCSFWRALSSSSSCSSSSYRGAGETVRREQTTRTHPTPLVGFRLHN